MPCVRQSRLNVISRHSAGFTRIMVTTHTKKRTMHHIYEYELEGPRATQTPKTYPSSEVNPNLPPAAAHFDPKNKTQQNDAHHMHAETHNKLDMGGWLLYTSHCSCSEVSHSQPLRDVQPTCVAYSHLFLFYCFTSGGLSMRATACTALPSIDASFLWIPLGAYVALFVAVWVVVDICLIRYPHRDAAEARHKVHVAEARDNKAEGDTEGTNGASRSPAHRQSPHTDVFGGGSSHLRRRDHR